MPTIIIKLFIHLFFVFVVVVVVVIHDTTIEQLLTLTITSIVTLLY